MKLELPTQFREESELKSEHIAIENPNETITETQPYSACTQSSRTVFATTFVTIFLAEFGDKTQLSTLLMSAESQSPWIVFGGAAAAMIVTSLLGVLVGCWIATRIAPQTVEKLASVSLLLISMMLFWDVLQ
uniref:TMEM165/GDT1 family protein n=1 Tax=Chroococcidiopsis sp. TS-821 TaxID=1378066 RepID=UPI000CEE7B02|nr:TMEM165/GDT1 family protein [Chroococcidiopsis sp. TS-821]